MRTRQLQFEIELRNKQKNELENTKIEIVDLTADDSFPFTVTVLSNCLVESDIPNAIWVCWI